MTYDTAYLAIKVADNESLRRLLRTCNPNGVLADVIRQELARRNVA